MAKRQNWKKLLRRHTPMILPSAPDALVAKLIELAGFPAYQIGGFALDGARFGYPDMDVTRLGEKSAAVSDIIHACGLPVLVDCDDGYGDEKNVAHTVHTYENIGASAIFIEDQQSPKKCGHMARKKVVPARDMVNKLKAAASARRNKDELFLLARTDALAPEGLDEALRRAEMYLKAGADGVYIEGPENHEQLRAIGREFKGIPLAVTILEGGGKTPFLPPEELHKLGFNMLLYPTSLLFRMTRAAQLGLEALKAGKPMRKHEGVSMLEFEKIVDIAYWKSIEHQAMTVPERARELLNNAFKRVA
jgi:2-methylisocitrate lyase-like PEP mutase family enzyme